MLQSTLALCIFALIVKDAFGHGRLMEPPNRSSLWRFNPNAPINYDDDQNYCGGMTIQWNTFGGKCGVCGDRYDDAHPQDNENTGKYGQGIIAKEYSAGSIIDIQVELTTNHHGYFNFSLCVLEDTNAPESGEDCFKPLLLGDGSKQFHLTGKEHIVNTNVKLPDGLTCDRCVLRWNYNAGNNWGQCEDGTYGQGCGPQETFRSCADVTIH